MFFLIRNFMSQDEVCAYVRAFGIANICCKTCHKIRKLVETSWDKDNHVSYRCIVSLQMWIV